MAHGGTNVGPGRLFECGSTGVDTPKTKHIPINLETKMTRTFLTIAMAAQLVAGAAFAQTSTTTTGATGDSMTSSAYGSDWSPSLGAAMFNDDRTTMRSNDEIISTWTSLSEADKTMVRRDCTARMNESNTTTGSAGTDAGTASGKTAAGAVGTTSSTTGTTSSSAGTAPGTASGKTAAATSGTTSSTNFATTGSTGAATTQSGAAAGKDAASADTVMQVSATQMDLICAATKGY
jgi:hypothetical protein